MGKDDRKGVMDLDSFTKEDYQGVVTAWSNQLALTPINDLKTHTFVRRLRSRAYMQLNMFMAALDDIENVLLWTNVLTPTKSSIRIPVRTQDHISVSMLRLQV